MGNRWKGIESAFIEKRHHCSFDDVILMEQGGEIENAAPKKAYLIEKGMDPARYGQIMKQAMGERKAGVQVLVSMMNKNKKFQKEQLNKEGYTEFVEFYKEALK